jgi:hypothetical protein
VSKRYEGSRSGQYGTAILVFPDGGTPYPLPLVDQWEHARQVYGDTVARATGPDVQHEWGYLGAGPADTAASLLADFLGEPQSRIVVQRFKQEVVARLPRYIRWTLEAEQVEGWLLGHAELVAREAKADDEYRKLMADADEAERGG